MLFYTPQELWRWRDMGVEVAEDGLHVDIANKRYEVALLQITGLVVSSELDQSRIGRYHILPLLEHESDREPTVYLEPSKSLPNPRLYPAYEVRYMNRYSNKMFRDAMENANPVPNGDIEHPRI